MSQTWPWPRPQGLSAIARIVSRYYSQESDMIQEEPWNQREKDALRFKKRALYYCTGQTPGSYFELKEKCFSPLPSVLDI